VLNLQAKTLTTLGFPRLGSLNLESLISKGSTTTCLQVITTISGTTWMSYVGCNKVTPAENGNFPIRFTSKQKSEITD